MPSMQIVVVVMRCCAAVNKRVQGGSGCSHQQTTVNDQPCGPSLLLFFFRLSLPISDPDARKFKDGVSPSSEHVVISAYLHHSR
jgi:hypothetical protein